MTPSHDRRWKVGELAKATGLTVRALHHYDDVGLLVPSERTDAGHRLYAEEDVRRLYRVLALRRLGLGLEEIASVLDDESVSLLEIVRRHLAQVERDLERQHTLRVRLRHLVDDQEKALSFYTETLGFVKKTDVPAGEARWLTVVSPEDPDGTELLLEPDGHPAAKPFKQAPTPLVGDPRVERMPRTGPTGAWGPGTQPSPVTAVNLGKAVQAAGAPVHRRPGRCPWERSVLGLVPVFGQDPPARR